MPRTVAPARPFLAKISVFEGVGDRERVELYFTIPDHLVCGTEPWCDLCATVALDASLLGHASARAGDGASALALLTRLTGEIIRCASGCPTRIAAWGLETGAIEILQDIGPEEIGRLQGLLGEARVAPGPPRLAPALRALAEPPRSDRPALLVFVTARPLADLEQIIAETVRQAREIRAARRPPTKLLLLVTEGSGVADPELRRQIGVLDHLHHSLVAEDGVDTDLWDGKVIEDLQACNQIWAELDTGARIPGSLRIRDPEGAVLAAYDGEFPQKVVLSVPAGTPAVRVQMFNQEFPQPLYE